MTLAEAFDMIDRGETPEQHKKRMTKIRKYATERDFLIDAIEMLTEPGDEEKRKKKVARLAKVERLLEELK